MVAKHGLSDWATVVRAPLTLAGTATPWYAIDAIPRDLGSVDLLVIDGPPLSVGPLARYPALPKLIGFLSRSATIIVDDADREDEQAMLRKWRDEFPHFSQTTLTCEKGCVVLKRNTLVRGQRP